MAAIDPLDKLLTEAKTVVLVGKEFDDTAEESRRILELKREMEYEPEYTLTTTGQFVPVKNRAARRQERYRKNRNRTGYKP